MGFLSFCKWKVSVGIREFLDFCMLEEIKCVVFVQRNCKPASWTYVDK